MKPQREPCDQRARLLTTAFCGLLVSLAACHSDFEPTSYLNQLQLVGARLEVVGDPKRSTPHPGERVEAQLVLVGDGHSQAREVSIMSVQCRYPERFTSNPVCQELLDQARVAPDRFSLAFVAFGAVENPRLVCRDDGSIWAESNDRNTGALTEVRVGNDFLSALGVTLRCSHGPAVLPINVAKEREPGDALLVRGVVCTESNAMFSPDVPLFLGCQSDDRDFALPFHTRIDIGGTNADNHNPDADQVEVWVNGTPWKEDNRSICDDPDGSELPFLDPNVHRIIVGLQASAFEMDANDQPEQYVLELFSNAGVTAESRIHINRPPTSDNSQSTFRWQAPADLARGEVREVHFWITARDQRGGFILLERRACIQRPDAEPD